MADTRTEDVPPWAAGTQNRMHELDPELTEAQIEVVRGYGEAVSFADGAWLWEAGERAAGFFLVLSGAVEVVNRHGDAEDIIITHGRGHYGGEIATMTGRGAMVGGRAKGDVEAIALTSGQLRRMIALEPQLGETVLLSFTLRRMRMIAETQGDVTLFGVAAEAETGILRSFMSRHGIPFHFVDVNDDGAAARLKALGARAGARPVVATAKGMLTRPTIRELAEHLQIAARIENGQHYDVVIIGGGPAGLAAAVYGASEGISALVIESVAPGGQAATSSRIENFFGFPTGISGQALTGRGFLQAHKFGAEIAPARALESFECGPPHRLTLDGGDTVTAGTVVIASGAIYREPPIANLERFTGGGVHYGASHIEAQLCREKDVAIVGGGNSAGQAAVFLSDHAKCVRIMIRGESLASSMSQYLIDRIERTPNIEVMPFTKIEEARGADKLDTLLLKDNRDGATREIDTPQLFIFIGAIPSTDFVPREVTLDDKGFVLTGSDLTDEALAAAGWAAERRPTHLETSHPGIYAVGDVRAGSVKRVASAVGEGSVCIQFVHRVLAEQKARVAEPAAGATPGSGKP